MTVKGNSIGYCSCRASVKLFRFLLSLYILKGSVTMQNCMKGLQYHQNLRALSLMYFPVISVILGIGVLVQNMTTRSSQ
jgi:hypothetical protein